MLKKAYLEITNQCNLACTFCHGTKRPTRYLSEEEFIAAAKALRPHTDYLYFHLMGEPLLHPLLEKFLQISHELGFKVIITTNGTLLEKRREILLNAPALHKVSISLHAYEANAMDMTVDEYLSSCFKFCKSASERGKITVMRLWNIGGEEGLNGEIIKKMKTFFCEDANPWETCRNGYKLCDRVFLEWGDKFEWPDENAEFCSSRHTCYGLRDQIGVLSDGRVVPCCLDAEGVITLGNIFEDTVEDILSSDRATALRRSFETRKITEPLCQRCGFAVTRLKQVETTD